MLLVARPVYAQFNVRPFVLFADERFAASKTFDATLQTSVVPFLGGGVDVVVKRRFFVDLTISHLSRDGQRAFINNGTVFRLGIPLSVTSTSVDVTGGYRFIARRSRIIPYVGLGFGSYSYRETSDFAAAGEDVDIGHLGFVMLGGAEFRVTRRVGISGDAHYTRVPGILGQGGLSKDAGENDFGGIAARLRVIIGR